MFILFAAVLMLTNLSSSQPLSLLLRIYNQTIPANVFQPLTMILFVLPIGWLLTTVILFLLCKNFFIARFICYGIFSFSTVFNFFTLSSEIINKSEKKAWQSAQKPLYYISVPIWTPILPNCVRVARQTLTLFVWVRILVRQPLKARLYRAFFVSENAFSNIFPAFYML